MIDLEPAAERLADVVASLSDEQLAAPTPCAEASVGDLVDHVSSVAVAFAAVARKEPTGPGSADASRLGSDWRERIPRELGALAQAWRLPDAWQGMTNAAGFDLPGDVAGRVALDEVVLHGWDLTRATGQAYAPTAEELKACLELIPTISPPEGRRVGDPLFGPVVPVPDDAPLLDRVVGLSGRNPTWSPPV